MPLNYFELFELPVSLEPDRAEVRRKYVELTRRHHPDYFVNKGAEDQENALEMSALLNKAFKTLGSRDETIAYVLRLKGLLEADEKYVLSPDFLMEMMEVNEQVVESAEDPGAKARLVQQLINLEKELYEPVQKIIENYREGVTTEEELLQVKDYYFKKKYLKRLSQQIDRMS